MSRDLRTVLHATTPEPREDLDVAELTRRGLRRRSATRARTAVAAVLVLTVGTVGGLNLLRDDGPVILDQPEQGALGIWEPVDEAPIGPREEAQVVVDGGTVVILGGESFGSDAVFDGVHYAQVVPQDAALFDADTDRWTALPPLPYGPVALPSLALRDGRLAVVGGRELGAVDGGGVFTEQGQRAVTAQGAVLDLATGTWTSADLPPGLAPRIFDVVHWSAAGLVAWGGWADDGELTDRRYMDGGVWTPQAGWTTIPPPPLALRAGSAVAVTDGHLVVWGGYRPGIAEADIDPDAMFADGAVYDLAEGSWELLPASPLPAGWTGSEAYPPQMNTRVEGDRVLIAGPYDGRTHHRGGAWLDLGDRTWTPITPAPDAARYVTAHPGGVVAVDDRGTGPVTLWRYDEVLDEWQRLTTRLRADVILHEVTAGRIVASSIGDDGQWQDSPRIGIWDGGSAMVDEQPPLTPRWKAAIAVLPDGVLVWGGTQLDADGEAVISRGVADGARLRW